MKKLLLTAVLALFFFSCNLTLHNEKGEFKELDTTSYTNEFDFKNESEIVTRSTNSSWKSTVECVFSIAYGKDLITWSAHPDASFYVVYGKMGSMWTKGTRFETSDPFKCASDPIHSQYYVRVCDSNGKEITGKLLDAP